MGRHQDAARNDLNPRQKKMLIWIKAYHRKKGFQPSIAEMAEGMCMSPSAIKSWLALAEKFGYIARGDGQARSIKFLK